GITAIKKSAVRCSVVPVNALAPFMALLSFDGKCRDWTRLEPTQRDRLPGLLAKAVAAVVDAAKRFVDLGDQLALAVAGAKLNGPVSFGGGPIGEIGMVLVLFLEVQERFLSLFEDLLFPAQQSGAEIVTLALVHKRLFIGRPVAANFGNHPSHSSILLFFCSEQLPRAARLIYACHGADNIRLQLRQTRL